jgi:hypothetical protein
MRSQMDCRLAVAVSRRARVALGCARRFRYSERIRRLRLMRSQWPFV